MSIANFEGKPGQNSFAKATETGLRAGQMVAINGNTDLSSIMRGNDDACAYSIICNDSGGIYDYILSVTARGPEGFGSGNWHLEFTDESGDTYSLKIYSSKKELHTLRYSSKKPAIVRIKWNN
jgi:hypothetical protein